MASVCEVAIITAVAVKYGKETSSETLLRRLQGPVKAAIVHRQGLILKLFGGPEGFFQSRRYAVSL